MRKIENYISTNIYLAKDNNVTMLINCTLTNLIKHCNFKNILINLFLSGEILQVLYSFSSIQFQSAIVLKIQVRTNVTHYLQYTSNFLTH